LKGDVEMNSDQYKEILKMAIENEVEAAEFYQGVYDKTQDASLKDIFGKLANEERGHRKMLEGFFNNESKPLKFKETSGYKVAESVEMPRLSMDMKPADAIALAMKKEQEAMEMYQAFAAASDDAGQKETFENLARMEQSHKTHLEDLYSTMAFPEVW